jgi:hypothetical protein
LTVGAKLARAMARIAKDGFLLKLHSTILSTPTLDTMSCIVLTAVVYVVGVAAIFTARRLESLWQRQYDTL